MGAGSTKRIRRLTRADLPTDKLIDVSARPVEKAGPLEGVRSVNLLISLDSPPSDSPILLHFFNSLGDIPFRSLRAVPNAGHWEPGQAYFVDTAPDELNYFYDDGEGFLYAMVPDGSPVVSVVYVWVFEQSPSTAYVSYAINDLVTPEGVGAAAELHP